MGGRFDLLYSTQDIDFDRHNGVFSIPSLVGIDRTLRISKGLHIVAFLGFFLVGLTFKARLTYYIGTAGIGSLFLGQHKQLVPYDLSKVNRSFFTYNGIISLAYLALVALELL